MSVPIAILMPCFFTSATARSVPATTCIFRNWLAGASGVDWSSRKGWKLNHVPVRAISAAVSSSIRWACSMTLTPAAIERRIAAGV